MMFIQLFAKFLRTMMKLIFTMALGSTIAIGCLYLRLLYGPLDLTFIQEPLQKSLNKQADIFSLTFTRPYMAWQGWRKPIEIYADNVHVHHKALKEFTIVIPQLAATFRLRSLLQGELVPSSLVLKKPVINIDHHAHEMTASSQSSFQDIMARVVKPVDPSKDLKRLSLEQAHIVINDPRGWGEWTLTDTTIIVERNKLGVQAHLGIHSADDEIVNITLAYTLADNSIHSQIEVRNVNPAQLLKHIPIQALQRFGFDDINTIQGINIPLSITLNGHIKTWPHLADASFVIHGGEGTLSYKPHFIEPLVIKTLDIQGQYHDYKADFDVITLQTADGDLNAKAQCNLSHDYSQIALMTQSQVSNFSIEHLNKYWPVALQPEARDWVINNIKAGLVTKASLTLGVDINWPQKDLKISQLQGEIDINKGTICYFPAMPEAENITAQANFDHKHFDIFIKEGTCSQDIHLQQGRVQILDLDRDDPYIKIDTQFQGDMRTAYDLIALKPLQLTKDIGIPLVIQKGIGSAKMHVDFPLKSDLTWAMVNFQLSALYKDLSMQPVISSIPLMVTQGSGRIDVDNAALVITCHGFMNGDRLNFAGQHALNQNHSPINQAYLNLKLSSQGLMLLQPDIKDFIEGTMEIEAHYKSHKDNTALLSIDANLNNTALTFLNWRKIALTPGRMQSVFTFKNNNLTALRSFQLKAEPQLDIQAKGIFNHDLSIQSLDIDNFMLGNTHFQGSLKPHKHNDYRINITGNTFDLSHFMNTDMNPEKSAPTISINFNFNGYFKKVILSDGKNFYNNTLNFTHRNKQIHSLSYVAAVDTEGDKKIMLSLFPHPYGRRFVMKCDQIGEVFKAMGIFKNFYNGKLKLAATQHNLGRTYSEAPWVGKLVIDDFKLRKVPFLARLLTLAFPSSFSDLFSEDRFLSFTQLKTKFKATTDKLLLQDGRAYGPSMGFTIHGSVQHDLRDLHLYGSIIPAYFLNTLISKIPLIGEIISGGKHEGIFGVSYTVKGDTKAPIIQVNPVSAFMPGLLRRIFQSSEADDVSFAESDDGYDHNDDLNNDHYD